MSSSEIRRIPAWYSEEHPAMGENMYHVKKYLMKIKITNSENSYFYNTNIWLQIMDRYANNKEQNSLLR
jgi:hypothetical protein